MKILTVNGGNWANQFGWALAGATMFWLAASSVQAECWDDECFDQFRRLKQQIEKLHVTVPPWCDYFHSPDPGKVPSDNVATVTGLPQHLDCGVRVQITISWSLPVEQGGWGGLGVPHANVANFDSQ